MISHKKAQKAQKLFLMKKSALLVMKETIGFWFYIL